MMRYFREPFSSNIFIRCRGNEGKTNKKNIGLRIRQRTQPEKKVDNTTYYIFYKLSAVESDAYESDDVFMLD